MLRLEKLELRGFKSFCEPTEVRFHEGITAVVGPNGCGKSNILDSIAWVLGEQSARSLRGGKMDDVIFNGTRDRKPLGMAEVILTLVAVADISPRNAEVDDIEIGGEPPPIIDPANPELSESAESTGQNDPSASSQQLDTPALIEPAGASVAGEVDGSGNVVKGKKARANSGQGAQGALKRALSIKRAIPAIAAGEKVTIARRLYRSGESDYLMNGHTCRLRDIHDFFAGTGLGGAQYAIIEQGHIGQILSSKPQERRALIEEAAGITKFKAKKHLAELKLEATRQNLSRLSDIISEVDRQLVTLKRQAAKAKRYRRLREQMREYWRALFSAEHHRIETALAELAAQLTTARTQEETLSQRLNVCEEQYRARQTALREQESALDESREEAHNLEIEVERTRNRINYQREQQQEMKNRAEDFRREMQGVTARVDLVEKETARRRNDLSKINQELSQDEIELNNRENSHRALQEKLNACERELDTIRTQMLAEVSKTERLRHLKQQIEDNLKRVSLKQQSLANEATRAEERRDGCEHSHESLRVEISNRAGRIETFGERLDTVVEQLERETSAAKSAQSELDELVRDCARTEDRLASLVELDEQRAYFSEAVQQLLSDERARREYHLLGTLADYVDVEPQYETMIERVMSERLQAVLVPAIDDALAAAKWLEHQQAGRATFLVLGLHGADDNGSLVASEPTNTFNGNGNSTRLIDLLGLKSSHSRLLQRALPELAAARVADNLASALEISAAEPTDLVVTSIGEQVRACSLLMTGTNTNNGASVLQLKREIKELTARMVVLQEQRETAGGALAARRARISQLELERGELDRQLRAEEKQLAGERVELNQSERELERARQHLRVLGVEREQSAQEHQQLSEKLQPLLGELTRAEETRSAIDQRIEQMRVEINRLKPDVETSAQTLAGLRATAAAKAERRRAATNDLRRLEDEQKHLARRSERSQFELLQLEGRSRELVESLATAESSIVTLDEELANARALVETHEHELSRTRKESLQLETLLSQLRGEIARARDARSHADIETARLQTEAQHLEQVCRNELAESLATIIEQSAQLQQSGEATIATDAIDLDEINRVLLDLRNKLDELGPVNMMALEELEETEKRFTFLEQQHKDVLDSIKATEEALREIKRRSRTRFREAFEQINTNFSATFQELFGGGRGEMMLLDEEDVLESGIDIIAQPPGKRLQSVLLLSGGEKAMTALALVMAIFRFRPSPFCVLDEVDAPLDDMNIGRFTEKILQMSTNTQFLVITHSKRTMESASSIYGVTMEEPGVSKLLSVKFDKE